MKIILSKYRSFLKVRDKLEKLGEELDKKKIFLLILLSLVILYIDFSFIIKLQLKGVRSIREKIIKIKKDIGNLNKDLAALQNLKQKQTKVEKKQEEILKAKRIISEGQIPLLLQDISDLANRYKVKIMQIRPSKDAKAKEEVIEGEAFLPITIMLDLSCTYHSLGSFINALENTGVFIAVQDIKIRRSSDNYLSGDVDLTLKTYVKK